MSDTATIETLTAEVRTLMVGSRQVTLSVAKQLDEIPLVELTVFGRVKLGKGDHVIGAAPDGSLAVAGFRSNPRPFRCYIDGSEMGDAKIVLCERLLGRYRLDRDWISLRWGTIDFDLAKDCAVGCGITEHKYVDPEFCDSSPAGNEPQEQHPWMTIREAHREQFDRYAKDRQAHIDAASAPLIVLAGLK